MSKTIAVGGTQNDGFVGDIVTSTLTEAQFQAQRNGTWVLMDGRAVGGSRYSTITGSSTIPDARGMFLRGKNNGRVDGLQNPDGDLSIGTYQADAFASHAHTGKLEYNSNSLGASGGTGYISTTGNNNPTKNQAANLGLLLDPTGGNETRPKNITVNYFIKIN